MIINSKNIVNIELRLTAKVASPVATAAVRFGPTCSSGMLGGETGNFCFCFFVFLRSRLVTSHGNPRPPRLPRRLQPWRRERWPPTNRPLLKHSERQGGSLVLSSLGPAARRLSKQPQRHKDKAEAVIPSTGGLASHFLVPRGPSLSHIDQPQIKCGRIQQWPLMHNMNAVLNLYVPLIYCNTETSSSESFGWPVLDTCMLI